MSQTLSLPDLVGLYLCIRCAGYKENSIMIISGFLYLICVISIGWSILVFGGPNYKRLISGYSDGALKPLV